MDNFCQFVDRAGPPLTALSTHWSVIRVGIDPSEAGKIARREISKRYYRPVFHLLMGWGLSLEKAAETTNRLMELIIDGKVLEEADAKKGSFRFYLMRCLQNLLRGDLREEKGRREVSLENVEPPSTSDDPMAILDREIAWQIFDDARRATKGRLSSWPLAWKILRMNDLEPSVETQTQEVMAGSLRIGVDHFRDALYRAREVFKEEVSRLLAEGVESEAELREEIVWFREQIRQGPPPPVR